MPATNPQKRHRIYLVHTLAWLVFIFFGTLNRLALNPHYRVNPIDIFFTQLPSIYVFYVSNFILFRFLSTGKYLYLAFAEVLFFFSYLVLVYIDGYWIAPIIDPGSVPPPFHPGSFLVAAFWIFFLYSYFSFGYYMAMQAIRKERELRITQAKKLEAEQERLEAEQDKLRAEYSFLRSQINPHFLHNVLNFFYSKSLGASQELADGILTLSEVMRYSLEGGDTYNEVLLSKEVDNLKKVIKINELRFSSRLNVNLSVRGNIGAVQIIPLILITLVENAFKHGELTNPKYPVGIEIDVDEEKRRLYFGIFNRKKTGPKEPGHGIGMDNLKKRLEHAYKNKYELKVKDDKEFYGVELIISFQDAAPAGPWLETTAGQQVL